MKKTRIGSKQLDQALLGILQDGRFHSGEALGLRLGVSRAAIWKRLQLLGEVGIDIQSVRGKGYRLAVPLALLEPDQLVGTAVPVELLWQTGSTNADALAALQAGERPPFCIVAEHQRAGRGRRGRDWLSPLAGGICLSLAWRLPIGAPQLEGLSLAVGLTAACLLERHGLAERVRLKWPNDIWVDGKKIAGVLIELAGNLESECDVVIGVGINGRLAEQQLQRIDQPCTDYFSATGRMPDRALLVRELLADLRVLLERFAEQGFPPLRSAWQARDALHGQAVQVHSGGRQVCGVAEGVDEQGALRLRCDDQLLLWHGGEVTLRAAVDEGS